MGHVVPSISKLSARDGQTLRCHPREHVTVCYVSATCQIRLDPRWRPLYDYHFLFFRLRVHLPDLHVFLFYHLYLFFQLHKLYQFLFRLQLAHI